MTDTNNKPPQWMVDRANAIIKTWSEVGSAPAFVDIIEAMQEAGREVAFYFASQERTKPKCDGNHAGPPCRDPECWAIEDEDQRLYPDSAKPAGERGWVDEEFDLKPAAPAPSAKPAGKAIKAAYVRKFGSDEGWLSRRGSWFIEGYLAAAPAPAEPAAPVLTDALRNLLRYAERNQCTHEETHRGGTIWTICNGCGKKWADDEGGFQEYVEPKEITAAREALATTKPEPAAQSAAPAAQPVAQSATVTDRQILDACSGIFYADFEGEDYDLAIGRAVLALAAPALQESKAVTISDEQMDKVREAVAVALGEAYDCLRVWSAWSHGTMRADDFALVSEDIDRVSEIAQAAVLALAGGKEAGE